MEFPYPCIFYEQFSEIPRNINNYLKLKLLEIKTMHLNAIVTVNLLASSAGGPGFNPQPRTASYQRRYKNGTSSALV